MTDLQTRLDECSYTYNLSRLKKKDLANLRTAFFESIPDNELGEYINFEDFLEDSKFAAQGLQVIKNAIATSYLDNNNEISDTPFNNWLKQLGRIIVNNVTQALDEQLQELLDQAHTDRTEEDYLAEVEKEDHTQRSIDINMEKNGHH
tara:strand:- start:950 stop:1393 length:444 start_codon:yes stop_codon:yes gene_type:complete